MPWRHGAGTVSAHFLNLYSSVKRYSQTNLSRLNYCEIQNFDRNAYQKQHECFRQIKRLHMTGSNGVCLRVRAGTAELSAGLVPSIASSPACAGLIFTTREVLVAEACS